MKRKSLNLVIPWPPSANLIWRKDRFGRIHLSTDYKRFLAETQAEIISRIGTQIICGEAIFTDRVAVSIALSPPKNLRFDIDNRIKPTLDVLTKSKVWKDDSQVWKLEVYRIPPDPQKKGYATITISE